MSNVMPMSRRDAGHDLSGEHLSAEDQTPRFLPLSDGLPVQVAHIDTEQRYVSVNAAFVAQVGATRPEAVIGKTVREILGDVSYATVRPHIEAALRGEPPTRHAFELSRNADVPRVVEAIYSSQVARDGAIVGCSIFMVDITERHNVELANARLAAVVYFSGAPMIGTSRKGLIESWNPAAEQVLGYTAAEAIGMPVDDLTPDDRRTEPAEIARRICAGETITNLETVRVTKDGRLIDVLLTPAPILTVDGSFGGTSATLIDITERKAAEETQRLLIDEINHRVKNTLNVLQAIAQQTLMSARDPAHFVDTFSGRVQALSRVHGLLTRAKWAGADLETLVRDQIVVDALDAAEARRVVCSGPACVLERQAAVHLALVLHELGANARKYGALSVAEGTLHVTWSLDDRRSSTTTEGSASPRVAAPCEKAHGEGWPVLELHWRESGGPPVGSVREIGFGTKLIERSLAHAHGGDVSLRFEPDGVQCDIRLPLVDHRHGKHPSSGSPQ